MKESVNQDDGKPDWDDVGNEDPEDQCWCGEGPTCSLCLSCVDHCTC